MLSLPNTFSLLPLTARARYKILSQLSKCMFSLLGLASNKCDRCSLSGSSALPGKHMRVCTSRLQNSVTERGHTSNFQENISNDFSPESSGSQKLLIPLFAQFSREAILSYSSLCQGYICPICAKESLLISSVNVNGTCIAGQGCPGCWGAAGNETQLPLHGACRSSWGDRQQLRE